MTTWVPQKLIDADATKLAEETKRFLAFRDGVMPDMPPDKQSGIGDDIRKFICTQMRDEESVYALIYNRVIQDTAEHVASHIRMDNYFDNDILVKITESWFRICMKVALERLPLLPEKDHAPFPWWDKAKGMLTAEN